MGKLTAVAVKAALENPGTYQDGDGLFLKVDSRGGATWKVRLQRDGKRTDYDALSVEKAKADKAAAFIADNPDVGLELPNFPAKAWDSHFGPSASCSVIGNWRRQPRFVLLDA